MANYATLKAAVQAVVKSNGNKEITGTNMQSTIVSIINELGAGYQFMGVATPSTSPGTPDYNVAYIGGAGTYTNFGTTTTVPDGCLVVFKYNGSWTNSLVEIATVSQNVTGWSVGYVAEDKTIVYLDTWRAKDIAIDSSMSAVSLDLNATGAVAYCYLLNSSNGTLISWHNEMVNTTIDLTQYPTAARLLVCSRAEYPYKVVCFYKFEHLVDVEIQEALDGMELQEDTVNSNSWRKPSTMKLLKDGSIIGVSVPSDNTAMAFYKYIDNCWWIRGLFNHGSVPATGSGGGINAGLVMSSNMQGRLFTLTKMLNRSDAANKIDCFYYSPPLGGFVNAATFSLPTAVGADIDERLVMSGDRMSIYINNSLLGSYLRGVPFNERVFGGVLMSYDNKFSNIEFGTRPTRYAHFSLDDVGKIMKTIADSSPASIFQNEMFAFLKDMHEKYGMTVTLNLYYSVEINGVAWSLTSFPNTYRSELYANRSWLKFAFHGGDETITYNSESNNTAALNAFNNTNSEINRFAHANTIDLMPRLTFFSGNKALLNSLYATKMFLGCLTADDTRDANCGLNATEREAINNGSDYIDFANNLYYVKSRVRFDTQTTAQVIDMVKSDLNNNYPVYEYFTHAPETISEKDRVSIEEALKLLVAKGVRMDFAMNNMPF